jgi:hypothetical protein
MMCVKSMVKNQLAKTVTKELAMVLKAVTPVTPVRTAAAMMKQDGRQEIAQRTRASQQKFLTTL